MVKKLNPSKPGISIIVPINTSSLSLNTFVESIQQALQPPVAPKPDLQETYEIIVITNQVDALSIHDIVISSDAIPVAMHVAKDATRKSELINTGVHQAQYDTILTLDPTLRLPEHSLAYITTEMSDTVDFVAAFPKYVSIVDKDGQIEVDFEKITNKKLLEIQQNPETGALIFTKDVWNVLYKTLVSENANTVELIYKAQEAGYQVVTYDLLTEEKKLLLTVKKIKETFRAALSVGHVKMKKASPIATPGSDESSMVNAGMRYKKQKFVTHSTLSYHDSAINSFTNKQIFFISALALSLLLGFIFNLILVTKIVFTFLSILYLIDVFFNIYLLFKTIRGGSEIKFMRSEIKGLKNKDLPVYTILCPMYKEAHMLAPFLNGLSRMEWPEDKLDVIILLEEDDKESIETISKMSLPKHVRMLVVPSSQPQTKPKACNYGLAYARGEYIVIYDAEDIPDPLQLKKAYIGFQKSDRNVVCLQAKLNYHNPTQNLLTRFFTAEYSWLFDVSLPGLQSLNTIIPLGGTSNHFRKTDLIKLNGWDPFNVTEDADLGLRIFKNGYRTAIIDSVTLEEANSNVHNWIRQRSRWIKGYMQTYLVHTREILPFLRQRGLQALMLHLVIGGKILFIFVNPILWIVTISYFTFHGILGEVLEESYSPEILYSAVFCLIFGNYSYLLGYILACVKREHWGLIKYVYLIPIYLLLISIAGCMAFYQLLFKPHYWEKTIHGLHLINKKNPDDELPPDDSASGTRYAKVSV